MHTLAERNGFTVRSAHSDSYFQADQAEVRSMLAVPRPAVYVNHHSFVGADYVLRKLHGDHTAMPRFVNIQLIRHPIRRAQSAFHYLTSQQRSSSRVQHVQQARQRAGRCGCAGKSYTSCIALATDGCPELTTLWRFAHIDSAKSTAQFLLTANEYAWFTKQPREVRAYIRAPAPLHAS